MSVEEHVLIFPVTSSSAFRVYDFSLSCRHCPFAMTFDTYERAFDMARFHLRTRCPGMTMVKSARFTGPSDPLDESARKCGPSVAD